MIAETVVAYIDGGPGETPASPVSESGSSGRMGRWSRSSASRLGTATNNVAEYRALLAALEWARAKGHCALHVRSDSLLLVRPVDARPLQGKHPGLQPLHAKARVLVHDIGRVSFKHVGRGFNAHADRLANKAMDDRRVDSLKLKSATPTRLRLHGLVRLVWLRSSDCRKPSCVLSVTSARAQRSSMACRTARNEDPVTEPAIPADRAAFQRSKNIAPGDCPRSSGHRRLAGSCAASIENQSEIRLWKPRLQNARERRGRPAARPDRRPTAATIRGICCRTPSSLR